VTDRVVENNSARVSAAPDGTLYYTTSATAAEVVVRALSPMPATNPKTLATLASANGYLGEVVVGGSDLFFSQSNVGIIKLTPDGKTSTFVSRPGGVLRGVAVDAANVYYADSSGMLFAQPRAGEPSFPISSVPAGTIVGPVADGTRIFWAEVAADGKATLKIRGKAKADGPLNRASLSSLRALAFDADYVYLVSADGELRRVLKDGVSVPELIGEVPGSRKVPKGIAVDDDSVYLAFTEKETGGTIPLDVYQVSKCGGPMRLIADDTVVGGGSTIVGGGLVAVGPHLYWGRQTSIGRMAK